MLHLARFGIAIVMIGSYTGRLMLEHNFKETARHNMNLKTMLSAQAERYGDKTAIVSGESRLSYAELDKASNKAARAFLEMGVGKGDRVAMLALNSPEFVVMYFGIVKIGAITVPLDTKYKLDELTSLFTDSKPKVLLTETSFLRPLLPALPRFGYIEKIITLDGDGDGQFISYREIMADNSADAVDINPSEDDIASTCYTSGPAFRPRGSMLSHKELLTATDIAGDSFHQDDKDVAILFALPMHHIAGMAIVLLTSLVKGSTVVMLSGLSIDGLLRIVEREKVSVFTGVPFVFALMANAAEESGIKYDLSSLRICTAGGSAMPVGLMQLFKKLYGLDVVQWWALTESLAQVTCQPVDGSGTLGSVGTILPGWEVKIVDNNGNEVPEGQEGEIIARGPLMRGYYNNLQATAEVMKEGFLYTGDLGKFNRDQELFITGLKKDLIIAKGQNICPSDIEDVLHAHPKIAEVAVVGMSDELRGEVVRAVIRLKDGMTVTEQEIRRFCLKRIANYKIPKQIVFRDALPRTVGGKIDKASLKG
ncbi:class I adenylate-forming enzyme family protein [Chloroflexota bacterium]